MNIHPIFVHFPVALLSLYSVFELVRFRKIMAQDYWFYIKAIFVIIGTLFSYAALYTGGLAEDLRRQAAGKGAGNQMIFRVIDVHSNWAVAVAIIFSLISVVYIIEWLRRSAVLPQAFMNSSSWNVVLKVNAFLLSAPIIIPLAVVGLIAITVTGSLGGAVEYGANSDPVVHFIYNLVF
jgi:uncharacterized membrane protein